MLVQWIPDNEGGTSDTNWTYADNYPWGANLYDSYPTSLDDSCKEEIEEIYEEDDCNDFIPCSVVTHERMLRERIWIAERTSHDV